MGTALAAVVGGGIMTVAGLTFAELVAAIPKGRWRTQVPLTCHGRTLVIHWFIGFDVIPQSAEECDIPPRRIGKCVIISVLIATACYVTVILAT